jgi:hypothetical protein
VCREHRRGVVQPFVVCAPRSSPAFAQISSLSADQLDGQSCIGRKVCSLLKAREVLMRQAIPHIVAGTIALSFLSASAASAIECKAEMPSTRSGYWSWRVIDGKRCWYPGRAGMDKANLQWPKSAQPLSVDRTSDQVSPETYSAKAQSYSPKPEELSFEQRWPH